MSPWAVSYTHLDEEILIRKVQTVESGTSVCWKTRSSLWSEKYYLLDVSADSFLYRVQVKGQGAPDAIEYFSGVRSGRWGAQYEAAGYLVPMSKSGVETYTTVSYTHLLQDDSSGSYPYAIMDAVVVSPFSTGIFAAMVCTGVS